MFVYCMDFFRCRLCSDYLLLVLNLCAYTQIAWTDLHSSFSMPGVVLRHEIKPPPIVGVFALQLYESRIGFTYFNQSIAPPPSTALL